MRWWKMRLDRQARTSTWKPWSIAKMFKFYPETNWESLVDFVKGPGWITLNFRKVILAFFPSWSRVAWRPKRMLGCVQDSVPSITCPVVEEGIAAGSVMDINTSLPEVLKTNIIQYWEPVSISISWVGTTRNKSEAKPREESVKFMVFAQ